MNITPFKLLTSYPTGILISFRKDFYRTHISLCLKDLNVMPHQLMTSFLPNTSIYYIFLTVQDFWSRIVGYSEGQRCYSNRKNYLRGLFFLLCFQEDLTMKRKADNGHFYLLDHKFKSFCFEAATKTARTLHTHTHTYTHTHIHSQTHPHARCISLASNKGY